MVEKLSERSALARSTSAITILASADFKSASSVLTLASHQLHQRSDTETAPQPNWRTPKADNSDPASDYTIAVSIS
jgi:hypothetical protein